MTGTAFSQRFSAPHRNELRRLAGVAHDRELGGHLAVLELQFRAWHAGELDAAELAAKIHEFHQGPNRRVFLDYQNLDADVAVARALARDILREAEVPEDVLAAIAKQVEALRALADL